MGDVSVELAPLAIRDIEAAVEWYDEQSPSLGDEFLGRVDEILARLAEQPLLYPRVEGDVRRALLHQFPYAVYYVESPRPLMVVAVVHTSRRPDYWREREPSR